MAYDNPIMATYRFPAISVVSAATLGYIVGPAGKSGRVLSVAYVITTGVTVAASNLIIGVSGTTNAYATTPVAVAAAATGGNAMTIGATGTIPADSVVTVGSAGGATAGAVDALVTIGWY